jgi:hypothetical protein
MTESIPGAPKIASTSSDPDVEDIDSEKDKGIGLKETHIRTPAPPPRLKVLLHKLQ